MEHLDEQLKINICNILPSISEETVSAIIQALKYVGLETLSDLQLVQEEDILLVLKPIQRRKLIKAWNKQDVSNPQFNEISHKLDVYSKQPTRLKKEENRQSESMMTSKSEIISPVTASCSLSVKRHKWTNKRVIRLLQLYTENKLDFLHPDVEEQAVWKKIALQLGNCDELQCRNKINELRCEYEKLKNKNVTNRETAFLLDEAERAFVTTETTEKTKPSLLKKSSKAFRRKLLQVYIKYKTEIAFPDTEEQNVWEKIAREMRETFSYACGKTLCRFELFQLKIQYENIKKYGVVNGNMPWFFHDARKAFEVPEKLDLYRQMKFSNEFEETRI